MRRLCEELSEEAASAFCTFQQGCSQTWLLRIQPRSHYVHANCTNSARVVSVANARVINIGKLHETHKGALISPACWQSFPSFVTVHTIVETLRPRDTARRCRGMARHDDDDDDDGTLMRPARQDAKPTTSRGCESMACRGCIPPPGTARSFGHGGI